MAISLEDRLCETFGYSHVALAGWARSAMVALLEALELPAGAPFVFPANICPAVLAAAVAAKLQPAPVAVGPESGLADDASLAATIARLGTRGVVMPTHLYGARLAYPKTQAAARAQNWFVLENDTMATTAGATASGFGDALLVSFSHDKTLDAGGGGAIFANSAPLVAAVRKRIAGWPLLSDTAEATETELALARRHLRAAGTPAGAEELFRRDLANVRYALPDHLRQAIAGALDRRDAIVRYKRDKLALWDSALKDLEGELLPPSWSPQVPWRAIRRLKRPALRKAFADTLRTKGFDVGHNYPSLAETYPMLLGSSVDPSRDRWGQSVVNFWLTDRYDAAHVAAAAQAMKAFFAEHP